ncbi:hypothetical protein [Candidatus Albibeggiatoa sp. nov. NOAA]|uniref:hypothetical protein n=1 Tax=Candidatus Albibeggiatoa sp. nov. NOAA TaxID=3162724 RepID=UPI0032FFB7C2|nr:hypothetical protein [Thiotrichaceae bacterium]
MYQSIGLFALLTMLSACHTPIKKQSSAAFPSHFEPRKLCESDLCIKRAARFASAELGSQLRQIESATVEASANGSIYHLRIKVDNNTSYAAVVHQNIAGQFYKFHFEKKATDINTNSSIVQQVATFAATQQGHVLHKVDKAFLEESSDGYIYTLSIGDKDNKIHEVKVCKDAQGDLSVIEHRNIHIRDSAKKAHCAH